MWELNRSDVAVMGSCLRSGERSLTESLEANNTFSSDGSVYRNTQCGLHSYLFIFYFLRLHFSLFVGGGQIMVLFYHFKGKSPSRHCSNLRVNLIKHCPTWLHLYKHYWGPVMFKMQDEWTEKFKEKSQLGWNCSWPGENLTFNGKRTHFYQTNVSHITLFTLFSSFISPSQHICLWGKKSATWAQTLV